MAVPAITDEHRAELSEHGFTIFPDVFTPAEMTALAARIEALQQKHQAALASEIAFTGHLAEQDPEIKAFVR